MTNELPMACACGDDDGHYARLRAEFLADGPPVPEDYDMVSDLIMTLNHTYQYTVTSIPCDMWFGIHLVHYPYKPEDKKEDLYIQCDRVVDGLLEVWDYLRTPH